MPDFLLDTNVFFEFTKHDPAPSSIAFLTDPKKFWTSSVVCYELNFGTHLLPRGRRRDTLKIQISFLMDLFENRILPVGKEEMDAAAYLMAKAKLSGRTPELADILIAGTAQANNLVLVTRNVRDFENLGVEIVNPWDAG